MPCARIRATVVVGVLLMLGPLHRCPLMASWSGFPRFFHLVANCGWLKSLKRVRLTTSD